METKIAAAAGATKDAKIIFFDNYTVHYYSQSSAPWEAAYVNCFQTDGKNQRQAGYLVFTYLDGTALPGQENPVGGTSVTSILAGQVNHLEKRDGKDFFVLYYDLSRFNDVINLLRFCAKGNQSMCVSADPTNHVWALGNNYHVEVGAQYKV